MAFPFFHQPDEMTCGVTALRMIARYYGKEYNTEELLRKCPTNQEGTSLLNLSIAAESIGFKALGASTTYEGLRDSDQLPCIIHFRKNHYVVVYKIKKEKVYVADPAHGMKIYSKKEFETYWSENPGTGGVVLFLTPGEDFYREDNKKKEKGLRFLRKYISPHKKLFIHLILGLVISSALQLSFPFLTQSVVDIGINSQNINFISSILIAQLVLFFSKIIVEISRTWTLLYISSKISIALANDFVVKLMKLPVAYFDVKVTGDILQRIHDNNRIEQFLTGGSFRALFSILNLIVFSAILMWYSILIFGIFLIGTCIYVLWIFFFLKRRAQIDNKLFVQYSQNQSKVIEMVNGMQEIKLHNAESKKQSEWMVLQNKLFKNIMRSMTISQVQSAGSAFINELKNIIIIFFSANLVLDGQITMGMMLSITFILGQLNSPVLDLVNFIQQWQDARLSINRLHEIYEKPDESLDGKTSVYGHNRDIAVKNISFSHERGRYRTLFENVSFEIPGGKTTAIVGSSGSGKTTLLKLLLKSYTPSKGDIKVGETNFSEISLKEWRSKCAGVFPDSYIFSDTIAANIALAGDEINIEKLHKAVNLANINDFLGDLPNGLDTIIGNEGLGLSSGQKQRIIIARAIYKDPEYLLFDEGTSCLDSNNEKIVMKNIRSFFSNRTLVIIAHRLSTVKDADQVIVLDKGKIVETGNHVSLIAQKGIYFELFKNQLELEIA